MGCSSVLLSLPVVSTTEWSPSSRAAPMDQSLLWSGSSFGGESTGRTLPPASLTPRLTGASPHVGESDADGGCTRVPDFSREGHFLCSPGPSALRCIAALARVSILDVIV